MARLLPYFAGRDQGGASAAPFGFAELHNALGFAKPFRITDGHSSPELRRTSEIGGDFHGRGEPVEEVSMSVTLGLPFHREFGL